MLLQYLAIMATGNGSSCLPLYSNTKFVSIYKPLTNKHFDKFMIDNRSRYGMILTPMQHVVREVINNRKNNIRSLYSFLTDQTPPKAILDSGPTFLTRRLQFILV